MPADDAISIAFGQVLRDIRLRGGMTQEQVAHSCGLALNYISELERGRRNPSLKTIFRLGAGLNVRPDRLMKLTAGRIK